jgi:hypothetical protein
MKGLAQELQSSKAKIQVLKYQEVHYPKRTRFRSPRRDVESELSSAKDKVPHVGFKCLR